jgi:hypothetical protein
MRYDVHDLAGLKEAVEDCTDQDRIVIFTDRGPVRLRVNDGGIEQHDCDERGNVLPEQIETTEPVGELEAKYKAAWEWKRATALGPKAIARRVGVLGYVAEFWLSAPELAKPPEVAGPLKCEIDLIEPGTEEPVCRQFYMVGTRRAKQGLARCVRCRKRTSIQVAFPGRDFQPCCDPCRFEIETTPNPLDNMEVEFDQRGVYAPDRP